MGTPARVCADTAETDLLQFRGLQISLLEVPISDIDQTTGYSRILPALPPDFDPAKDEANRQIHGLPLAFVQRIFNDPAHVILPATREVDGEERFKAIGTVDDRIYTAVHTMRSHRPRFISVRRSNRSEERRYRH